MSSVSRLRAATAAVHGRLDSSRFAQLIRDGRIDRRRYVDYLRAIAITLEPLNQHARGHASATVRAALARVPEWCGRLEADLERLAPRLSLTNAGVAGPAHALCETVRARAGSSPYLLGVAYVLVGSHRGNRSLVARLEAALGVDEGEGTRYMGATRGEGNGPWQEFTALLDRSLSSKRAVAEAIEGALATFAAFEAIFAALGDDAARYIHVSAINPDAGNYPIPQDLELLNLAIDAAERATEDFPYLSFRYGARGRRFAHSDSAWMLTLLEFEVQEAERQIDWLAGVLAARGIPSLCLEVQLRRLAAALDERRDLEGSARLEQLGRRVVRHRGVLDPRPIQDQFRRGALPAFGEGGELVLLCAVADQLGGLGACADNIRTWAQAEVRLDAAAKATIATCLDLAEELHAE